MPTERLVDLVGLWVHPALADYRSALDWLRDELPSRNEIAAEAWIGLTSTVARLAPALRAHSLDGDATDALTQLTLSISGLTDPRPAAVKLDGAAETLRSLIYRALGLPAGAPVDADLKAVLVDRRPTHPALARPLAAYESALRIHGDREQAANAAAGPTDVPGAPLPPSDLLVSRDGLRVRVAVLDDLVTKIHLLHQDGELDEAAVALITHPRAVWPGVLDLDDELLGYTVVYRAEAGLTELLPARNLTELDVRDALQFSLAQRGPDADLVTSVTLTPDGHRYLRTADGVVALPHTLRVDPGSDDGPGGDVSGGGGMDDEQRVSFKRVWPELWQRAGVAGPLPLPLGVLGARVRLLDAELARPLLPRQLRDLPERLLGYGLLGAEGPEIVMFEDTWEMLLELTRAGLLDARWWREFAGHELRHAGERWTGAGHQRHADLLLAVVLAATDLLLAEGRLATAREQLEQGRSGIAREQLAQVAAELARAALDLAAATPTEPAAAGLAADLAGSLTERLAAATERLAAVRDSAGPDRLERLAPLLRASVDASTERLSALLSDATGSDAAVTIDGEWLATIARQARPWLPAGLDPTDRARWLLRALADATLARVEWTTGGELLLQVVVDHPVALLTEFPAGTSRQATGVLELRLTQAEPGRYQLLDIRPEPDMLPVPLPGGQTVHVPVTSTWGALDPGRIEFRVLAGGWTASVVSDKGRKDPAGPAKGVNHDAVAVGWLPGGVFAATLAGGVGDAPRPREVAHSAAETGTAVQLSEPTTAHQDPKWLAEYAAHEANRAVLATQPTDNPMDGPASTYLSVLITPLPGGGGRATTVAIGDSVLYRVTPAGSVAESGPPDAPVDLMGIPLPADALTAHTFELAEGSWLLAVSGGVTRHLEPARLHQAIVGAADPMAAARGIVALARGGHDPTTVAVYAPASTNSVGGRGEHHGEHRLGMLPTGLLGAGTGHEAIPGWVGLFVAGLVIGVLGAVILSALRSGAAASATLLPWTTRPLTGGRTTRAPTRLGRAVAATVAIVVAAVVWILGPLAAPAQAANPLTTSTNSTATSTERPQTPPAQADDHTRLQERASTLRERGNELWSVIWDLRAEDTRFNAQTLGLRAQEFAQDAEAEWISTRAFDISRRIRDQLPDHLYLDYLDAPPARVGNDTPDREVPLSELATRVDRLERNIPELERHVEVLRDQMPGLRAELDRLTEQQHQREQARALPHTLLLISWLAGVGFLLTRWSVAGWRLMRHARAQGNATAEKLIRTYFPPPAEHTEPAGPCGPT